MWSLSVIARSLLNKSFLNSSHNEYDYVILCHVISANTIVSSFFTLVFSYVFNLLLQLLSFHFDVCPAHLYFYYLIISAMSFTLVYFKIHILSSSSLYIGFCVFLNLFSSDFVSFHVPHPYFSIFLMPFARK